MCPLFLNMARPPLILQIRCRENFLGVDDSRSTMSHAASSRDLAL